MSETNGYKPTTRLVHGPGHSAKWDFSHHVTPPLSSSTTYRLDSARRGARGFTEFGRHVKDTGEAPVYIYDRLDEPTRSILEGELADIEGGEACVTFASGMAAISAALTSELLPGDEVLAHPVLYGCTHSLFTHWYPRMGIQVTRVDLNDLAQVRARLSPKTRFLYFESPTNPTLELIDIAALRGLADEVNATRAPERRLLVCIDNTFATPFGQRPLEHGADIVFHSTTKYLNGHSDMVGGCAVVKDDELAARLQFILNAAGAVPGPFDAWLVLRGTKTLHLRMAAHDASGRRIAAWLADQLGDERVFYPGLASHPHHALAARQMSGFGGMISFETGSRAAAASIANRLRIFTLAESLGGVESLICHPASMTHASVPIERRARLGISDGLLRLSVGVEDVEDLLGDLEQAFRAAEQGATRPAHDTKGVLVP